MKQGICTAIGVAGAIITSLFGGWDKGLETLVIFMAIDYVSGLAVAGVWHRSPKTASGALESRAGWKGLCRKCMTLFLVLVAHRLDLAMATTYVRDAVVIGFVVNEGLSILENGRLMGVKYPAILDKALEVATKPITKESDDPEEDDGDL